jgi:hypothetical protein
MKRWTGAALDLRSAQLQRRVRDDLGLEVPACRRNVGWRQAEQILLAFATLDRDVDFVPTVGEIGPWVAIATGQVGAFDPH